MALPRFQLFEFNDSPWAPTALKDLTIEALSRTLEWGRVLRGLVEPFRGFIEQTGAEEVLDLCSGAGGPAAILCSEFEKSGRVPPRFLLTDLQPQLASWERLKRARPDRIDFVADSVDATQIPERLGAGRPRVIINALHHFPPALAGAILRSAAEAEGSPGVFMAEGFERNPLRFLPFAFAGIPALLATPALCQNDRAEKALLTWLTPTTLATSAWDGVVSTLRVYTEPELREMVAPLGERFRWSFGTYDFQPFGRGTYFYGLRA